MRAAVPLFPVLLLAACSSQPKLPEGQVDVRATSGGQPVDGAECTVQTLSGSWTVTAPAVVTVGEPNGDLRVACKHPSYRTSEVIIRAPGSGYAPGGTRVGVGVGGGFGGYSGVGVSLGLGFPLLAGRPRYPSTVVVEMTPLASTP